MSKKHILTKEEKSIKTIAIEKKEFSILYCVTVLSGSNFSAIWRDQDVF
jgi:hypothetical protein